MYQRYSLPATGSRYGFDCQTEEPSIIKFLFSIQAIINCNHVTPYPPTTKQTELLEPFPAGQIFWFFNSSHDTFLKSLHFLNILLELQAPGWDTVFRLHSCQCRIQGYTATLGLRSSVFPCLFVQGFHSQSRAQLGCENWSSDGYLSWHPSLFQDSHFSGDSYPSSISSLYKKGPHFLFRVWHFITSEHMAHEATPVTQVLFLILHST